MHIKGTIGLDIDGTITNEHHQLPELVISYLTDLYHQGWHIVFITGREFVYAMQALSPLSFPYHLATQNGADILKMPERIHLKSNYFSQHIVEDLQSIFETASLEFLLYSGYERGDYCYFRPTKHHEAVQPLLKAMEKRSAAPWKVVENFSLKKQHAFPMIKSIGYEKEFLDLEPQIVGKYPLNYVMIKDPKTKIFHYLLITALEATKQEALKYLMQEFSLPRPLIVAGDDLNDRDSLEIADVRIVMENAPASLKSIADIIAPLATSSGIIPGLNQAIDRVSSKEFTRRWD